LISLRNFAQSGHIGSFRSIVGEARGEEAGGGKDLGRVGSSVYVSAISLHEGAPGRLRHSIGSVTDGGRLPLLTIEFAVDLLLRHKATLCWPSQPQGGAGLQAAQASEF
jgi:hypothetical protein